MATEWELTEDGQMIRIRWDLSDLERADVILSVIPEGTSRAQAAVAVILAHANDGVSYTEAARAVVCQWSINQTWERVKERMAAVARQRLFGFEAYASYPRVRITDEYLVAAPPEVTLDAPAQAASIPAFLRDLACRRGAPPGTRSRNSLLANPTVP